MTTAYIRGTVTPKSIALTLRSLLFCGLTAPGASYAQEAPIPRPGFDVLHYEFSLEIPDSGSFIRGSTEISVRQTAREGAFRLDLVDKHVITLRINDRSTAFRQDSAGLYVNLPMPRSVPDTFRVDIGYEGIVKDGLIIREAQGRWTAFGDNWPNRARHWLPTVDHPGDKATVTWRIDAPANLTVIANGACVKSVPLGGDNPSTPRRLTVWETKRPIPTYVMVIAAAPLVSKKLRMTATGLSEFPGGIPQAVHAFPEDQGYIPGPFEEAVDIVEYFSRTIGPFPYEKLDHIQSSTIFGGMENASAIFYFDQGFKRRQINSGLIAHETAHQWFGDAVTPADWPHLWLSEGFATYWAELWRQHDKGDSTFRASMTHMRDGILRSRTTTQRPVIDTAESRLMALLNSNSYQKGAWILHMLRSTVGDTAFYAGMRLYYEYYKHRSASSRDFQQAMEASSGMELGWFFDQWLRRPGFIKASFEWNTLESDREVRLTVRQSGVPYRFPLRLAIETDDGKSVAATVDVPAEAEAIIRIPWSGRPVANIIFDPFVQLLWSITKR